MSPPTSVIYRPKVVSRWEWWHVKKTNFDWRLKVLDGAENWSEKHLSPQRHQFPPWSCSQVHYHIYSVMIPIWGLHSRRGLIFFLPASHSRPLKPQPPNIAGSKEGKILSCLTFCKRRGQISEVNHHEWSHLRVRPATPLCGWITRQSESPAEETAGDFLSALSPFMTRLTVPAPFTGMSCFAKRNR